MKSNNVPASVWRNPVHFAAFGFGAGAAKYAPGTFGTLAAVPLYLVMRDMAIGWYMMMTVLLFMLGVWLCERTSRDIGVHDHSGIVWDEIVGYLVTMAAAPRGWEWVVLGFLLFRLFDIWKPWPVKWCDRKIHGGLGIMVDDVVAALYAWLSSQLISFFW
ncbi:MAG TPA: phosphatidylglycerophosphatase A [Chromatiales bacterium]|nr:phosphatidylglycerophosphatase A [Chromatiales bacterium]